MTQWFGSFPSILDHSFLLVLKELLHKLAITSFNWPGLIHAWKLDFRNLLPAHARSLAHPSRTWMSSYHGKTRLDSPLWPANLKWVAHLQLSAGATRLKDHIYAFQVGCAATLTSTVTAESSVVLVFMHTPLCWLSLANSQICFTQSLYNRLTWKRASDAS